MANRVYIASCRNTQTLRETRVQVMHTLAPKIGELALTAAVLIPRITWIPNFKPIACTCCATSVKPLPLRDDGQRSGSGIGRPHSSIKSWPADHTEAPASSFRYHRKSTTTYCTEKEKLKLGAHKKSHQDLQGSKGHESHVACIYEYAANFSQL